MPLGKIPRLTARSLGMTDVSCLAVTNTNVPQFRPCGPDGGRLPPLQWGVPCFGWYHSTAQVIRPTWRAAGCRWNYGVIAPGNQKILIRCAEHHPYGKFVTNTVFLSVSIIVLHPQNAENTTRADTRNHPIPAQLSTVNCQLSTFHDPRPLELHVQG